MTFRPLPVMTIFTLLVLGLLLWLGNWQMTRSDWKAEAIEAYESRRSTAPVSLESAICKEAPAYDAAVLVDVSGAIATYRVYGQNAAGDAGWKLFAAFTAPDCGAGRSLILAQTGLKT